jgi:NADPH:quinone reductase-like Zn-dependent oxidoreductase
MRSSASLSFEEAAAMPVSGITALQALRDKGKVGPGTNVLINGASGGVGTFAVQVAKSLGATVTGVCSYRNVDLVRSLGADHVIDYTKEDFTKNSQRYDVIIDMVGNHPLRAYRRVMKPGGKYVMVGGPKGNWIAPMNRIPGMALLSKFVREDFSFMMSVLKRDDLKTLADLVAAGKLRPIIDRRYPLRDTAEAIRYVETGRARAKVVVTIAGAPVSASARSDDPSAPPVPRDR